MKVLLLSRTEYDYDYCDHQIIGTFIVEDDFDLDANLKLWDQETGTRRTGKNQHGSWTSKWSSTHTKSFNDWISERFQKIELVECEVD